MEKFFIQNVEGVKVLKFASIERFSFFKHGFSTRVGGVSPPPFNTLNLSFTSEDNAQNVYENQRRFLYALGMEGVKIEKHISLVHENLVLNLEEIPKGEVPLADGIVTCLPKVPIATTFADCIPIFLADPNKKAVGVIHAGWRGTFKEIAKAAVEKMVEDFGCRREDILACIGPGIGPCCFEVGEEVIDMFYSKFSRWEDLINILSNKPNKALLNLFLLNFRLLEEVGILKDHISIANLCTFDRDDLFFSYRRDGKKSGRMMAIISVWN